MLLLLASSGCSSRQHAPECPAPSLPAPPAWMMESQPSSLPLLDRIISPSEPN
jgi:hypothetical protein